MLNYRVSHESVLTVIHMYRVFHNNGHNSNVIFLEKTLRYKENILFTSVRITIKILVEMSKYSIQERIFLLKR